MGEVGFGRGDFMGGVPTKMGEVGFSRGDFLGGYRLKWEKLDLVGVTFWVGTD